MRKHILDNTSPPPQYLSDRSVSNIWSSCNAIDQIARVVNVYWARTAWLRQTFIAVDTGAGLTVLAQGSDMDGLLRSLNPHSPSEVLILFFSAWWGRVSLMISNTFQRALWRIRARGPIPAGTVLSSSPKADDGDSWGWDRRGGETIPGSMACRGDSRGTMTALGSPRSCVNIWRTGEKLWSCHVKKLLYED